MKVIKNKIMDNLLKKLETYKFNKKNVNIELNHFFNDIYPDIRLYNDDIIIRENENIKNNKLDREYIIKTYGNFSAFEDVVNHVHIFDIIDCSLMQSLKFGIIIKDILKNKLKSYFPNEKFVIVLTCDGKDKLNTIIRFHKFRKDEILYDQKLIDAFDHKSKKVIPCGFLVEEI